MRRRSGKSWKTGGRASLRCRLHALRSEIVVQDLGILMGREKGAFGRFVSSTGMKIVVSINVFVDRWRILRSTMDLRLVSV
jgi:hypothetical protein